METQQVGHTPGPWTIERPFGEPGVYIQCPTSALVATCHEPDPNTFNVDRRCSIDANARLIAAAPTMAEALDDCARLLEHIHNDWPQHHCTTGCPDIHKRVERARAALADAGL